MRTLPRGNDESSELATSLVKGLRGFRSVAKRRLADRALPGFPDFARSWRHSAGELSRLALPIFPNVDRLVRKTSRSGVEPRGRPEAAMTANCKLLLQGRGEVPGKLVVGDLGQILVQLLDHRLGRRFAQ